MSTDQLQTIAIFGASGNIGSATLKHLLQNNKSISITIISRRDSKATFPASSQITVKKGSYDDPAFLESALRGQEAVLITLAFMGMDAQPKIIDAAAKAGVKYIIPNEFGGDGENEKLFNSIPLLQGKIAARKQIESLGMNWIGVCTNPWLELSLNEGMFGISVPERTVTFYSGTGKWNSTSLEQAGKGIAALLSLPVTSTSNPRASLEHYRNRFAYTSSFVISQESLFESVKRVTGTTDADWKIERSSNEERSRLADEAWAKGDYMAGAAKMYCYYMGEGLGGYTEEKATADRDVLGLQDEDLDQIVRGAVENAKAWM